MHGCVRKTAKSAATITRLDYGTHSQAKPLMNQGFCHREVLVVCLILSPSQQASGSFTQLLQWWAFRWHTWYLEGAGGAWRERAFLGNIVRRIFGLLVFLPCFYSYGTAGDYDGFY